MIAVNCLQHMRAGMLAALDLGHSIPSRIISPVIDVGALVSTVDLLIMSARRFALAFLMRPFSAVVIVYPDQSALAAQPLTSVDMVTIIVLALERGSPEKSIADSSPELSGSPEPTADNGISDKPAE